MGVGTSDIQGIIVPAVYLVPKEVNPALQNLIAWCDVKHKEQNKDSVGCGGQREDRVLGALCGTYSGWKSSNYGKPVREASGGFFFFLNFG